MTNSAFWSFSSSEIARSTLESKQLGWEWLAGRKPAGEAYDEAPMPDFHLFANGPRPVAPFSHAVESGGWVVLTGRSAAGRPATA